MAATVFTRAEVAKHNAKESGWLIIHNEVYDVSEFYDDHPGGRDVLLHHIGGDATESFDAVNHSRGARMLLQRKKIGVLDTPQETAPCMRLSEVVETQQKAKEKSANACWVVIKNKVYDLTEFLDLHPGGRDVLLWQSGTDASKAYEEIGHSSGAKLMMKKYFVADLNPDDRRAAAAAKPVAEGGASNSKSSTFNKKSNDSLHAFIMAQVQFGLMILVGVAAVVYVFMRL
ncbi:cytochrome b-domain protein [Trypanosoma grayi]|uniref:cytochrome b-domain protein n=1 Tax=Trypanosoma grayi TaxID=71804 RepID=UPI0004F41EF7|nr:cytochrome b-domain protein [Trypanosoma grayi]KEG09991.1 cytochrome b-domain protein [Trypanosoma grayi]